MNYGALRALGNSICNPGTRTIFLLLSLIISFSFPFNSLYSASNGFTNKAGIIGSIRYSISLNKSLSGIGDIIVDIPIIIAKTIGEAAVDEVAVEDFVDTRGVLIAGVSRVRVLGGGSSRKVFEGPGAEETRL